MNETLREYVDSRGAQVRVDRDAAVIRGVKILGLESRNGRSYLPACVAAAARLYEGIKVNVNHPKGALHAPRDYQDRIGLLRGVAMRDGEGLFGDLHFNPKHALAEQLLWDAEHASENVGLSHNVAARTARRGDQVVVEAIERVESVDLVADPATTRTLFESACGDVQSLTLEQLRGQRPDLVSALAAETSDELRRLRGELERLQVAEAVQQRRQLIRRLLAEHRLPDPDLCGTQAGSLVSKAFITQLLEAGDETAIRDLVAERARLVTDALRWDGAGAPQRPQSREQGLFEGPRVEIDAATFARAIS
jgi:hypothetical protein